MQGLHIPALALEVLTYLVDRCLLKYLVHYHGHVELAVSHEPLILGTQILNLNQMLHLRFEGRFLASKTGKRGKPLLLLNRLGEACLLLEALVKEAGRELRRVDCRLIEVVLIYAVLGGHVELCLA